MKYLGRLPLLLTVFVFAFCSAAQAETYIVVGSLEDPAKVDAVRQDLSQQLELDLTVAPAEVADKTWYRLMFPASKGSRSVDERLSALNIQPWHISLDASTESIPDDALPKSLGVLRSDGKVSLLISEFPEVTSALDLERRLIGLDLPVFGQAKLVDGMVIHQVWVGPVAENGPMVSRLATLGFAAIGRESGSTNIEPRASQKTVVEDNPEGVELLAKPPAPVSYNPARLPPKNQ